jgi:hypothetical protein
MSSCKAEFLPQHVAAQRLIASRSAAMPPEFSHSATAGHAGMELIDIFAASRPVVDGQSPGDTCWRRCRVDAPLRCEMLARLFGSRGHVDQHLSLNGFR